VFGPKSRGSAARPQQRLGSNKPGPTPNQRPDVLGSAQNWSTSKPSSVGVGDPCALVSAAGDGRPFAAPKKQETECEYYFGQFQTPCWDQNPIVFPHPGTVAAFVLRAFSRNCLRGCDPGEDAHIIMTGGISRPRLADNVIQAKLSFRLASRALENGFVGPRFDPTSRATPASRYAVKGTARLTGGLPGESLRQPRPTN
jgi:hypothetical protein